MLHPATIIGGISLFAVLGIIGGGCIAFFKLAMPDTWKKMGFIRQQVVLGHLVIMVLTVIKIILRLSPLHIKYLWVIPDILNI